MAKMCLPDPNKCMDDFVNFMVLCPDLNNNLGSPCNQDTCATYMSHMHNIVYSKQLWEKTIYPLYLDRFNTMNKKED